MAGNILDPILDLDHFQKVRILQKNLDCKKLLRFIFLENRLAWIKEVILLGIACLREIRMTILETSEWRRVVERRKHRDASHQKSEKMKSFEIQKMR